MGRPAMHLNAKQLRVLRWVERGCPDGEYVDDNYGHRITAKALASRALVSVEGRGKTWRAKLTDAGAARLAEVDRTPRQGDTPDGPEAVMQLRARLDAEGGRLVIDTSEDSTNYRHLVQQFNRTASRPRGKTLRPSSPDWGKHLVLEYQDWFWDLVDIPEVRSIPAGSRLGSLAKAFLSSRDDQFVSKEALPRAARILEAIVRHAAAVGIDVRDPRSIDKQKKRNGGDVRGWSGHLELATDAALLRVQVRETPGTGGEKFNYYPRGDFDRRAYERIQRLPTWERNRNYAFVPTGRLELRVARPGFSFDELKWRDTKSASVESYMGEVFQQLEVSGLEAEAAKQKAMDAEKRQKRDWEAAMTLARSRFREAQEEALLVQQAAIWSRHAEVRAFLDELRSRSKGDDPIVAEWIRTGERVAHRLDAFSALATPKFPKPTAQDLEPYLQGWSAYGPRATPISSSSL